MKGNSNIKSGELEAFLGKNTSFQGKMGFQGMARLDGKFDGEIYSGDILIIGETAVISAEINVHTLVVDGKVSGNVSVTGKIEVHASGELCGNIATPALVIEEGGLFDGTCKMGKEADADDRKVTSIKENAAAGERIVDLYNEG
ncbi:MAG: polymer-forming cytoskeletal protein [Proteobacteria bacterium]|nr:polymer-forming cytoskeletal protein [Pseudomonadota bacterium]